MHIGFNQLQPRDDNQLSVAFAAPGNHPDVIAPTGQFTGQIAADEPSAADDRDGLMTHDGNEIHSLAKWQCGNHSQTAASGQAIRRVGRGRRGLLDGSVQGERGKTCIIGGSLRLQVHRAAEALIYE